MSGFQGTTNPEMEDPYGWLYVPRTPENGYPQTYTAPATETPEPTYQQVSAAPEYPPQPQQIYYQPEAAPIASQAPVEQVYYAPPEQQWAAPVEWAPSPNNPSIPRRFARFVGRTTLKFVVGATAFGVVSAAGAATIYELNDIPGSGHMAYSKLPAVNIPNAPVYVCPTGISPQDCDTKTALGWKSAGSYIEVDSNKVKAFTHNAIVAAEDEDFVNERHGISGKALVRATGANLKGGAEYNFAQVLAGKRPKLSAFIIQGGSTITRQAAGIALMHQTGRGIEDQIEESRLAITMAKFMTPQQRLELYENVVYFGRGAYGLEAASRAYFGVAAKDLTDPQSVMLACLIKEPSDLELAFTDLNNPKNWKKAREVMQTLGGRYDYVVGQMVKNHFITADYAYGKDDKRGEGSLIGEFRKYIYERGADNKPTKFGIPYTPFKMIPHGNADVADSNGGHYDYDAGRKEAAGILGINTSELGSKYPGLKIMTTIDLKDQQALYDAMRSNKKIMASKRLQGSAISIDPDGRIKAMIGGDDYYQDGNNYALNARRGQGSQAKLFSATYAFEHGLQPTDILHIPAKSETNVDGTSTWKVTTGNGCNRLHLVAPCDLSIEDAFGVSSNQLPPQIVQKFAQEGNHPIQEIGALMNQLGVPVADTHHPAFLLGVCGCSPENTAEGYASVMAGGEKVTPYIIDKLVDGHGKVLWDSASHQPQPKQVYRLETAKKDVEMLKHFSVIGGTNKYNVPNGIDSLGGKTGTEDFITDVGQTTISADAKRGVRIVTMAANYPDSNTPIKEIKHSSELTPMQNIYVREAMDSGIPVDLANFVQAR
jgi:membrane peptidoglycan carboxypeptidase